MRKSSIKSWNCPCMSPQTVTGHFYSDICQWAGRSGQPPDREQHTTGCTLDSSCNTSLAWTTHMINLNSSLPLCQNKGPTRSHSRRTSSSANCLQVIKLSIQPSKVGMDPGSLVGDKWCGSGDRAVSISMLLSIASVCSTG